MKRTQLFTRPASLLAGAGLGLMIPLGSALATDYVVDSAADNTDADG